MLPDFDILLFIISIPVILKSSDIFIEGASKVAKNLGVSDFIIGITVVALGTSLPELASDSYASYIGHADIVVGDLIGSNITNIGLVLGLTCLIRPLSLRHIEIYSGRIHFLILAFASIYLVLGTGIGRIGGIIFIIAYILYLKFSISAYSTVGTSTFKRDDLRKDILQVVIGISGVLVGAKVLVNSIIEVSLAYGVSEYLIALLLMAFGTSLPELFISITAARKGYMTMVFGNIIGSNVANMLWVFGVAALIRPINVARELVIIQVLFMLLLSLLLIIFKRSGYMVSRKEGIVFFGIYVIFILVSITTGDPEFLF